MSEQSDERTASTGRRRGLLIPAVLIGLYVAIRVLIAFRSRPFTWYDTTSYAPVSSTRVFSFIGHAPRPWGAPLLFSIMPTNETRAIADWLIGTIAWSVLAYAMWITLRSRPGKIVGVAAILFLALTPRVVQWDFAIGSEPLSINLGVLALGLLMIWARTRSLAAFIGLAAAAFWWTFTRQDLVPMVALLIASLIWYAWRRPGVRKAAIAGIAVLVVGVGWVMAIQPTIEKAYADWGGSHFTLTNATFLYRLRLIVLRDPKMSKAYFTELGMPHCPPAEQIAKGGAWRMTDFQSSVRQCPQLLSWMEDNASSAAYKYALKHPRHYASVTLRLAPEMLAGPLDGQYVTRVQKAMPTGIASIAWPAKRLVLPLTAAITLLALVLAIAFRLFRRRIWLYTAGFGLVAISLASTVAGLMYTAGEYARFGIQEAVGLRLGLVILIVTTIDGLFDRRKPST